MNLKDFERFKRGIRVNTDTGCHEWIRGRDKDGYGLLKVNKGDRRITVRAHKVIYEHCVSQVPEGGCVLHKCDVRFCVNPAHLYIGSQRQNVSDMYERGRQNTVKGAKHPRARLNEAQVREIKQQLAAGAGTAQLGRLYGVCSQAIYAIAKGNSWKHI
jgi:hypothetical protein